MIDAHPWVCANPQGLKAQSASDFSFKNGLFDVVLAVPDSAAVT